MQKQLRLATYIFLALSLLCMAGWHDSGALQAWPATNHLQYGVTGYGTNMLYVDWRGYYETNLWWFYDTFLGVQHHRNFPIPTTPDAVVSNNSVFNAKDTRIIDCMNALLERWLVVNPGNNVSNFWTELNVGAIAGYEGGWYVFWRYEPFWLGQMKQFIDNKLLTKYIDPGRSNPTNLVVWNRTNLFNAALAPTNFFGTNTIVLASRSPRFRAGSGSWTPYGHIITTSWVIATASTGVVTNATVDGFGQSVTIWGTNGQTITRTATNDLIQEGWKLEDYGWDTLRRVISKLDTTVRTNTEWGIGLGTNRSSAYSTSMPYTALVDFHSGVVSQPVDFAQAKLDAVAANPALPYYPSGPLGDDLWDWNFTEAFTNVSPFIKTNVAPYSTNTASFSFSRQYRSKHSAWVSWDGSDYVLTNDLWNTTIDTHSDDRAGNIVWSNYAAGIIYSNPVPIAERTVLIYARSNSIAYLVESNTISAGVMTYTTMPISIVSPPALTNWGFTNEGSLYSDVSGWTETYSGDIPRADLESWMYSTLRYLWQPPWPASSSSNISIAATTNIPQAWTPALYRTIETWHFDYE